MTDTGGGSATSESSSGPSRPTFRGCLVCYSAEWAAYGGRQLRSRWQRE